MARVSLILALISILGVPYPWATSHYWAVAYSQLCCMSSGPVLMHMRVSLLLVRVELHVFQPAAHEVQFPSPPPIGLPSCKGWGPLLYTIRNIKDYSSVMLTIFRQQANQDVYIDMIPKYLQSIILPKLFQKYKLLLYYPIKY